MKLVSWSAVPATHYATYHKPMNSYKVLEYFPETKHKHSFKNVLVKDILEHTDLLDVSYRQHLTQPWI